MGYIDFLLIYYLQLLTNTLFVNQLEDVSSELTVHTAKTCLGTTLFKNLVITISLKYGHVMFFLKSTDFSTNTEAFGQKVHQIIVNLIDLRTQQANTFRCGMLVTNNKQTQNVIQDIRCNLLFGITPRLVRITMTFDDKSVKAQIHSLLTQRSYQVTTTTDMTRVTNDRKVGYTTMQFDRNLPHRKITINLLVV